MVLQAVGDGGRRRIFAAARRRHLGIKARRLFAQRGHLFRRRGAVEEAQARTRQAAAGLAATTDAIRIDQYPLLQLAAMLDTLRRNDDDATAQQYGAADLLLTTAYVALAEDYLTGQIDPKSVAQSWHIDVKEEEVDSALATTVTQSAGCSGACPA